MTVTDIIANRLVNHHLIDTTFKSPQEAVAYMGAMQAQEFELARWAIGLRVNGITDADVIAAFNKGDILRTHMLRPTWHFVSPADIRNMQMLTAPRVHAINGFMYRKTELTSAILNRSTHIICRALEGGNHLTRTELQGVLAAKKIIAHDARLSYIIMYAELECLICSGARQGNQFTYALLEERVPPAKTLTSDEALADICLRYFTSRGPATIHDFAWWSGLTVKQTQEGVAMLPTDFIHQKVDNKEYIYAPHIHGSGSKKAKHTFIIPDYDEYGISYKDRSAIFSKMNEGKVAATAGGYTHTLIVNGIAAGTWKRTITKKELTVATTLAEWVTKSSHKAVAAAVRDYERFFTGKI